MTEHFKSALKIAAGLRAGSWDGTVFRMNTFSCANHASKMLCLESKEKHEIKEMLDKFEAKYLNVVS